LGDDYANLLADQRTILREVFTRHEGQEVDTQGDAFFYSFPRATEAVSAAVEAQQAVYSHDWPEGVEVRIRMGLHTGEPLTWEEGYLGIDVHRAERLAHVAYGGQVLISETTKPLVMDDLANGVGLRDLGDHRLKDLRRPERVFQLIVAELPSDFPALRSLDAQPNNLPIQPTSLVGRDVDLASARALLSRPEVRLLTLSGAGGTGKTRLGLQLAANLLDEFSDGVYFVPLAPIIDHTLVISTVAQTLGVRDSGAQPILDTLAEHLLHKQMLLFMDNFEHVSEAAPEVSKLLEICTHIKFLISSREILHVRGEFEFPVNPLSLPDLSHQSTLDLVTRNPAVELFSQRAQAVNPNFHLTDENANSVAEICARLDGLPLAIELAAARVKLFSPKALLKQLMDANGQSSLHLLGRGPRDAPERHRTLRAAMDWSYDLLDIMEQRLIQLLSVFAGGFTYHAAVAVCSHSEINQVSGREEIPAIDVLKGLASLLDKSLIRQEERLDDETRFNMLELIRDYAWEKLKESSLESLIRERHAIFFLTLVQEAAPKLKGSEQEVWLERLEEEHNNLRSALKWFVQQAEEGDEISADSGVRMAGALWGFWDTHGYISEGRGWLRKMIELNDTPTNARVDALNGAAMLAWRQTDTAEALQLYERGLLTAGVIDYKVGRAEALGGLGSVSEYQGADDELVESYYAESLAAWQEVGDKRGIATALGPQAQRAASANDFEQANLLFKESLSFFREVGDKREIAGALWNLGQVAVVVGRYEQAVHMYRESRAIYEELKDLHGVATQLRSLADVEANRGNTIKARALYEEALTSFRSREDLQCTSISLVGLARVVKDQEDLTGATALILECLNLSREIGFKPAETKALRLLGKCDLTQGSFESAQAHFLESLQISQELGLRQDIAESMDGLASMASAQADYDCSVKLFSAAEALRVSVGIYLPEVVAAENQKWKELALSSLGESAYETAAAEGALLSVEQAIELMITDG
jgi:predicted ATPase